MVLFLIASGLSLIFGVTRVVNFAHGSFYMLAAYLAYTLAGALPLGGVSFYVAVALAALAVGAVGTLVEIALLRRVYRAPELYQLLLTFALVLVVSDVVKLVWGSENKTGPSAPGLTGAVRAAGQLVPLVCSWNILFVSQSSATKAFGLARTGSLSSMGQFSRYSHEALSPLRRRSAHCSR